MTDVTNELEEQTESVETEVSGLQTELSAEEQLKAIQTELESKKELIKQLRKYEKSQKEAKEQALKEQNNFKELYEQANAKLTQYEQAVRNAKIDAAIEAAAQASGVKSINTLQKLIDRSRIEVSDDNEVSIESVKAIILELQQTDSILFELPKVETPAVKRANDDTNVSSFETDLRKATSQKEIESVLARWGKLK